jgi:sialate O-acetylesterase
MENRQCNLCYQMDIRCIFCYKHAFRMILNRCWKALLAGVSIATVAQADVVPAPLFADGMVLQRDQPIQIWGTADATEKVRVGFAGRTAETTTGPDRRWLVVLPAQPASTQNRDIQIRGNNFVVLHDVLVGDVWICSGQSNMEFVVRDSRDGAREVAAADQPLIRHIKIGRKLAKEPLEDFTATPWRRADPAHVGDFTAVGYFFARDMVRETGVPIGLINCSWSGTSVEPWMSAKALAAKPEFAVVGERWQADLAAYPGRRRIYDKTMVEWEKAEAAAKSVGEKAHQEFLQVQRRPRPPAGAPDHPYPGNPSQIYNGMVYPLRHAAIRGVLWYQGEANAVRAKEYAALFKESIVGWRETFGRPELPFYYAQIANFTVDTDWPRLREAQVSALEVPNTGMAVTIDIGDPDNIHPVNKQEVGHRLALIALAKLEHRPVEYSGPIYSTVEFSGGEARVSFAHSAGLQTNNGPVASLELAGVDRIFHSADGRIERDHLIVNSPAVPAPVAVRYAWAASPRANLYNAAGLPASPFRSDDW